MIRRLEYAFGFAGFHDHTKINHHDVVRDVANETKIVTDDNQRGLLRALHVEQSSVIAACTDTSSADTGSSATTSLGAPAKARAIPTRCFCPPDNWLGRRLAEEAGKRVRLQQRAHTGVHAGTTLCDA